MARKESSPRMSSLASLYMKVTPDEVRARIEKDGEKTAEDIRSLAASVLSQDLTPGQG